MAPTASAARRVIRDDPFADYSISIDFGSDSSPTEGLVKRVFREIERLKSRGPTPQKVNDVKQALLRDFETNTRLKSYLLTQTMLEYQGDDPVMIWDVPKYYENLEAAAVQHAAKTHPNTKNYVKVMLMPEKKSRLCSSVRTLPGQARQRSGRRGGS